MAAPTILVFSGSIRSGSVNNRLVDCIVRELVSLDCEVTRISLGDYALPVYNGDLEAEHGIPENAVKLARLFHEHDGFFVASSEYNGSLTPLLKNTLDWISRVSSDDDGQVIPYRGKLGAISAASPGAMGGISMLYHLREILVRLGVLVISEQVAVGQAGTAFDDDDRLTNERTADLLKGACKSLVDKARMMNR